MTLPADAMSETTKDDEDELEGCIHEKLEPHLCPYQQDVNKDSTTLCTCCERCQQTCADDI